jgi:PAS domain S-box-containing protein
VVEIEIVDGSPIVRTVNPAFETVFGYDREQVLEKSLNKVIVPEACSEEATQFDERTADGRYNSGVVTRMTDTGPREFLYRGVPYERDGQRYGFAIYTDITERKERKRELRRQKEQLEQFAQMLSHDIRNPLTVAQGRLEMIDDKYADVLGSSLDRIQDITDDVLALVRTGSAVIEPETVTLSTIASKCWHQVETENGTLSVEDDIQFDADVHRL